MGIVSVFRCLTLKIPVQGITPSSARLSTPEYGKFHKKLAVFFGISL